VSRGAGVLRAEPGLGGDDSACWEALREGVLGLLCSAMFVDSLSDERFASIAAILREAD
jgi:hypothetical protein